METVEPASDLIGCPLFHGRYSVGLLLPLVVSYVMLESIGQGSSLTVSHPPMKRARPVTNCITNVCLFFLSPPRATGMNYTYDEGERRTLVSECYLKHPFIPKMDLSAPQHANNRLLTVYQSIPRQESRQQEQQRFPAQPRLRPRPPLPLLLPPPPAPPSSEWWWAEH